jgi:hypothetical protein
MSRCVDLPSRSSSAAVAVYAIELGSTPPPNERCEMNLSGRKRNARHQTSDGGRHAVVLNCRGAHQLGDSIRVAQPRVMLELLRGVSVERDTRVGSKLTKRLRSISPGLHPTIACTVREVKRWIRRALAEGPVENLLDVRTSAGFVAIDTDELRKPLLSDTVPTCQPTAVAGWRGLVDAHARG